jgi:hypothetical protein
MTSRQDAVRCPKCDKRTRFIERVWNPKPAGFLRISKCECGELVWEEQGRPEDVEARP